MEINNSSLDLARLNWVEGKEISKNTKTAIIPIGATEQHGPHLPIGTDTFILQGIISAIKNEIGPDYPVLFLPSIPFGKSPEHLDFFGTISLQATTIISIMNDICFSLQKHGFKSVVFLNTHGGNLDLLKAILYDIRDKYDLFPYCIHTGGPDGWDGVDFTSKVFPELTIPECHAGSVETSIIAFLHPELVKKPEDYSQKMDIPEFPFGWKTSDLSNNGVIGDPKYYSAEAGKAALNFGAKRIHNILDQIVNNS
jgi:creatinine amidohydrolase